MSEEYGKGPHTVYDIQYHVVWVTKYRYQILSGEVALRTRELIRQSCEARNITILSGHVSRDHIHVHVSSPPELSPSKIAQYIKGRSSRIYGSDTGAGTCGPAGISARRLAKLPRR